MKWQSFKGWTLTLNDSKGWVQSVPCQLLLFLLETFSGFACLDLKRCGCCSYWWRCHLKGQLWDRSPGHWQTTVHVSFKKKQNWFFTETRGLSWATYGYDCKPGGAGKERFPQQSPNCWPQGRGGAGGGEREPVTEKTWRGWRRFHHPGGKQE